MLFSGCQILNIKKNQTDVTIHAVTRAESTLFESTRIKAKINIFKDSIVVSASHSLGIEIAKFTLTDRMIHIDQKFQNKKSSFMISDFVPKFKIKEIKKIITKTKEPQDTTLYQNSKFQLLFTNYTCKENLFLPQKITFWTKPSINESQNTGQVNLEYKSVKFSSKKKK